MNNSQPVITQDEVVSLLGRPLSEVETKNFNIYLEIATVKLKDSLCCDSFPDPIPVDLKLVIAKMFGSIKATQDFERENGVTTKRVEDFYINYTAERKSPLSVVVFNESATIAKYSQCSSGIKHGKTMI